MRPSNAIVTSALPVSGVKFQYDMEMVRAKGARDAANAQLLVVVAWADAPTFEREVVGFTTWLGLGVTVTLERTLPLRHPLRPQMTCDEYELVDCGSYPERRDLHDPANPIDPAAPAMDWCRYLLTFTQHNHFSLTDAELAARVGDLKNKEQARYVLETQMPRPRERRVSGFAYEFQRADGTWKTIEDESQFIPDYQIDIQTTWLQVPISAVPYNAILDTANKVNKDTIRLIADGRLWTPEELLFKGLAKPIEIYTGSDGGLYYDLCYNFCAQPGTWNKYPGRDAAGEKIYRPIRIRAGAGAGFPPYPSAPFQSLFTPGF